MRNICFKWNMDNFKFNFLSRGQFESLSLDTFFLTVLKILPCQEVFLVTEFLPLLLKCSVKTILIAFETHASQNLL